MIRKQTDLLPGRLLAVQLFVIPFPTTSWWSNGGVTMSEQEHQSCVSPLSVQAHEALALPVDCEAPTSRKAGFHKSPCSVNHLHWPAWSVGDVASRQDRPKYPCPVSKAASSIGCYLQVGY